MVFVSFLESIGIILLIPLVSLTGILDVSLTKSPVILWVSEFFKNIPITLSLAIILGIYVLLIIGQSIFQRKQMMQNVKIQQGFTRYLREETYKALLQSNWGFFLNKKKSDIINLMTTELARVSGGTYMFLQFLTSLVFTLIQVVIAFLLSPQMSMFVILFGIALIYCSRRFIKKSNSLGEETLDLSHTYLAGISDHFNGIKDIKSNRLEMSHLKWFQNLCSQMERNVNELIKMRTLSQSIYKIVSAILIAIFVFFSIKMFHAQTAQLMLILLIFSRIWPQFSSIQSNLEQLGAIIPSFKALIELKNECKVAKEFNDKESQNIRPLFLKKGFECRNIVFRYDLNEPIFALKNINLHIPVNKMTAIVGRSGAGKSTLIDIIMGLNKPELGQLLMDDTILTTEKLLSLRESISYVPQDPFLFNATIRENLYIINQNSSEEQLWEALEFATAADFVRKLPSGLDTLIGDRGVRLSGGERQRLVLTRAILRNPSILILDEATSALDSENESKIQTALESLKGKMTIIVIAHRLSTIRNADQVIVLDNGKVIQQGQFNQLTSEKKGMFSNLLRKQMGISL